jgi:hypothetical protein
MSLLTKLRQAFCRHEWRLTIFQALVGDSTVQCVKCGRMEKRRALDALSSRGAE